MDTAGLSKPGRPGLRHGLHARGNFEGFVNAASTQKWLEVHVGSHWAPFYTDYGVTLQLRWRQYESRKDDVDGAYFNPERYRQWQGVVAMRRRVAGWIWTGALGAGRETVNGTDDHPVRLAELRGEGPLTDRLRLAFYDVYNRSTGYVDAPDYSYRQFGVTLIYPL